MKKKQSENYLEYVPVRTPETEFTVDETGIVTLTKEWTGFYHRIAQRFFHKPRVSRIALDGYGSFIWKLIVARQFFCETRTRFLRKNKPFLRSKS